MKQVKLTTTYNTGTQVFEAGDHQMSDADAERAERLGATKAQKPARNKATGPTRNKSVESESDVDFGDV